MCKELQTKRERNIAEGIKTSTKRPLNLKAGMICKQEQLQFVRLSIIWQLLLLFAVSVNSEGPQTKFVGTVGAPYSQLQNRILARPYERLQEPTTQTHDIEELLADLQQRHSKLFNELQAYSEEQPPANVQFGAAPLLRKIQLMYLAPHSTIEVAQDFDKLQRKLDELKGQIEAMNLRFDEQSLTKQTNNLANDKSQNIGNVSNKNPLLWLGNKTVNSSTHADQRPSFIKRIMSYIRPAGLRGTVTRWPIWTMLNGTGINSEGQEHSASYVGPATEKSSVLLSAEELLIQLTRQRAYLDDIIKRLEFTSTNTTSIVN